MTINIGLQKISVAAMYFSKCGIFAVRLINFFLQFIPDPPAKCEEIWGKGRIPPKDQARTFLGAQIFHCLIFFSISIFVIVISEKSSRKSLPTEGELDFLSPALYLRITTHIYTFSLSDTIEFLWALRSWLNYPDNKLWLKITRKSSYKLLTFRNLRTLN